MRILRIACVLGYLFLTGVAGLVGGRSSGDAGLFGPSNARTLDGSLIPVEHFIPAERCESCHQDTHRDWSQSLHRNAAREPFYRESANILLATRGVELTRHCEACHTPVALFSGALDARSGIKGPPFTALDDEGVTCSVCHSIVEARLDGTGSYTIRRPALLEHPDGRPVYGEVSDEAIMNDIAGHRRAMMRPLLRTPEFCAVCHKVDSPPGLNDFRHVRGFSAYDEWQESGASLESVSPFHRRERRADCRTCHMPRVPAANDLAARNDSVSSHRWPGANTAVPLFYGHDDQVALTEAFLAAGVLEIDIFALRFDSAGHFLAPLGETEEVDLTPDGELIAEVVVSNRNAAHSFPPEVRDLYQAWVEFMVVDSKGTVLFHSGAVGPDGTLDGAAHVYQSILLDENAKPITRHQVWLTRVKAYDRSIPAGRSDLVRFGFRLPSSQTEEFTLRASVRYRRFNKDYTDYVFARLKTTMSIPTVLMAHGEVKIRPGRRGRSGFGARLDVGSPGAGKAWRRWNDYGIGLLEQRKFGPASRAFERAIELNPTLPDLYVNRAISEAAMERFGPEREQLRIASRLIEKALNLDRSHPRARLHAAVLMRAQGRHEGALDELTSLSKAFPRDRRILRDLGLTLHALNRLSEAAKAFESLLTIDPTDADSHQFLASIYAALGRRSDSKRAANLYLQWREHPESDAIARRFFAENPNWREERAAGHVHRSLSPARPTLTGGKAAATEKEGDRP